MKPDFDKNAAHKFFAVDCFNRSWDLIEKKERTPQEDEEMIRLNAASTWHWTQRPDCTARNLSIGYWQASRIRAIVGHADEAKRYATLCLEASRSEEPFYLGFAYEALARAEFVAGNIRDATRHLEQATALAAKVKAEDEQKLLKDDLESLGRLITG